MNKKLLPLAVTAAAVSMSASAQMYVNDNGTGEILVFPFYSAENGNVTNINLVNTTAHGKAIKVRFIEGQNSKEVLDFNVYMSPKDHFSMAVSATADGGGQVTVNDKTCTVPQFAPGVPEPFRDTLYVKADAEAKNNSITRTAVGYIEVLEMGQLKNTNYYDAAGKVVANADGKSANAMLAAITHDSTGTPANCDLPDDAWATAAGGKDGQWKAESKTALGLGRAFMAKDWDGGGLYGYAGVVNANDATAFGEDAVAIDNAVITSSSGYEMHYEPGSTDPDFEDPALTTSAAISDGSAYFTHNYAPSTVDAVSALFQTQELINDYVTDTDILAQTDWIVTFPTKTFYVNLPATSKATRATRPFWDLWDGKAACEYATLAPLDREESTPAPAPGNRPDFSPAPPGVDDEVYDLPLCKEVTVVQFGDASAVKTNDLAVGVADQLPAADGWASISFDPALLSATAKKVSDTVRQIGPMKGLPVTGFAVQTYGNSSLNGSGSVANYAMSVEHKAVVARSQ